MAKAPKTTDEAEAAALVESEARCVVREDAGLQGPQSGLLGLDDEAFEQRAADAAPASRGRHVDAHLTDAAVAAT